MKHIELAESIIRESEKLIEAQKSYFRHHNPNRLDECKLIAKSIEAKIKEYRDHKKNESQPKLFR